MAVCLANHGERGAWAEIFLQFSRDYYFNASSYRLNLLFLLYFMWFVQNLGKCGFGRCIVCNGTPPGHLYTELSTDSVSNPRLDSAPRRDLIFASPAGDFCRRAAPKNEQNRAKPAHHPAPNPAQHRLYCGREFASAQVRRSRRIAMICAYTASDSGRLADRGMRGPRSRRMHHYFGLNWVDLRLLSPQLASASVPKSAPASIPPASPHCHDR